MPARQLNVGVASLGRMGKNHAINVANSPRAKLVAVCDPFQQALDQAKDELPESTALYTSFEELLAHPGIEAVVIATPTSLHAPMCIQALKAGKHVLLEKPISIDLASSLPVLAEAAAHPELKVMVALSRRFDASNRDAYARRADLGEPYLVKSATNDMRDPSGFFVKFSATSGGIALDMGIHDCDAARWFFGFSGTPAGTKQVKRCFAIGHNARHPELSEHNDFDNAQGLVEFVGGKQLNVGLSRTAVSGHECFTEVYGTEAKFIVNSNPVSNRLQISDVHGVRAESTPTYYERFHEAFVTEVRDFTACVLDDTAVPTTLDDALEAAKIAVGLTLSLRSGQQVLFDDDNFPIAPEGFAY